MAVVVNEGQTELTHATERWASTEVSWSPMANASAPAFAEHGRRQRSTRQRLQSSYSALIVLTSTPTLLTSISTVSPGFIHTGGLRRAPTPPGVPVTMTSPGSRMVKVEM